MNELELAWNEIEKGEKNFQLMMPHAQDLEGVEKVKMSLDIARGIYYLKKGKLDLSLKHLKQGLLLQKKYEYPYFYSSVSGYIGRIHESKGELEIAESYYQNQLASAEEMGEFHRLARSYQDFANLFWKKNNLKKAIQYYNKSLNLFQESNNELYLPETIYNLVLLSLKLNDEKQADSYLAQLKTLCESSTEKDTIFRYQLAKAAKLKKSKRIVTKSKAQVMFQEVADEENIPYELTMFAIMNLCDLLLVELKAYGEEEVLQDVQQYLRKLKTLAATEQIFPLLVESLLLQARVTVIEGDLSKAMNLVDQARITAEEKTLYFLLTKATAEKTQLEQEYEKLQTVFQGNISMQERLEQTKLREYLEEAQQYLRENS